MVGRFAGTTLREIGYPARHIAPEHSHGRAYFSLTLKGNHTEVTLIRATYRPGSTRQYPTVRPAGLIGMTPVSIGF